MHWYDMLLVSMIDFMSQELEQHFAWLPMLVADGFCGR